MKRLTYRDANGEAWYSDAGTEADRLHFIAETEDILTDCTIERLRELIEADRNGRCIVLPEVDSKARDLFSESMHDVFTEWSYSDPSTGIYGMTEDEKKLASAIMAALERCESKNVNS